MGARSVALYKGLEKNHLDRGIFIRLCCLKLCDMNGFLPESASCKEISYITIG